MNRVSSIRFASIHFLRAIACEDRSVIDRPSHQWRISITNISRKFRNNRCLPNSNPPQGLSTDDCFLTHGKTDEHNLSSTLFQLVLSEKERHRRRPIHAKQLIHIRLLRFLVHCHTNALVVVVHSQFIVEIVSADFQFILHFILC